MLIESFGCSSRFGAKREMEEFKTEKDGQFICSVAEIVYSVSTAPVNIL